MANRVPMLDANGKVPQRFLPVNNAPAGSIVPWSGTGTVPGGWLLADGSAVSRVIYADLFAAVGTAYGVGDGTTTFNLPDMKGRVAVGQDAAQTEFDVLGETGGAKYHAHPLSDAAGAQIIVNATATPIQSRRIAGPFPSWTPNNSINQSLTVAAVGGNQTVATGLTGTTDAGSSLQPYITLKYIISVGGGGTGAGAKGVVGEMIVWPGGVSPDDFLLCDGTAINRTTYADLFVILGTTYGAGDGSTTFNLPDMRGRAAFGADASQAEFLPRGKTGGTKTETLTAAQIPAHTHPVGHGGQDAFIYPGGTVGGTFNVTVDAVNQSTGGYYMSAGNNVGGGGAHNNLPPYIAVNYVIRYRTTMGANDTNVAVADTTTIDMTLTGDGTKAAPYTIKGDVRQGISIPAGANINIGQYVVKGSYHQATDANATIALGYPLDNAAGSLEVDAGAAGVWQTYTIARAPVRVFSRYLSMTATWTEISNVGTYLTATTTQTVSAPAGADLGLTVAKVTCTPGTWILQAGCSISTNVADTVSCAINVGATLVLLPESTGTGGIANGTAGWPASVVSRQVVVVVGANTDYSPMMRRNGGSIMSTTPAAQGPSAWMSAIRIA